jgi:hypothetical protein
MPRSKHRRKPGERATAHPGQGRERAGLDRALDRLINEPPEKEKSEAKAAASDLRGLPLFNLRIPRP